MQYPFGDFHHRHNAVEHSQAFPLFAGGLGLGRVQIKKAGHPVLPGYGGEKDRDRIWP